MLEAFKDLLIAWNKRINLVSTGDLDALEDRHIADSIQVFDHRPSEARSWLDVGSGGGFPGLIAAICAKGSGLPIRFTLIESDVRKCAFLREAVRITGTDVQVVSKRIEAVPPEPFDVISARALAHLPKLLSYTAPFSHPETVYLFPKGAQVESELTQAMADWHVTVERIASRTDARGTLLKLTEVSARS
ncbi:MAG: 16S rRNA (guanine(527)-N(7))-methyltransferase RsmG [Pseudomonadota bacterium]